MLIIIHHADWIGDSRKDGPFGNSSTYSLTGAAEAQTMVRLFFSLPYSPPLFFSFLSIQFEIATVLSQFDQFYRLGLLDSIESFQIGSIDLFYRSFF